ncbi:N-carbamoyl-L-amino-acid hydrolase [Ruminiclostridium sufflavum DSM 19573]|uniref:N-carbamoyl-L-amino-acid hydrolase n=1 Tax=Ruminiclostridium sufflavum DSM 19573 TaxID=1121337 RepID=A0A318XTY7_9FIRM|nr:hydantoinase/carbamoylase family amidase [Ruminiclostridium sufflavum]PYG90313.1 N-carbamoyl-L-amino-acid hydrolase [Ruminiclostridium sufflavum DSM 19573]
MKNYLDDTAYAEYIFDKFYSVGSAANGGVTRLGYSKEEDEMHEIFKKLGEAEGHIYSEDEVGNSFLYNKGQKGDCYLIGSHLDSVIEGGRYDGVAGIITGLLILHWAELDKLSLPIAVGAFRCEESSNFGRCTLGSGLVTEEVYKQDIGELMSVDGRLLKDIFKEKNYTLHPKKISGIKEYIELHIEQGKVLEEYNNKIGIVETIAGPRRFYFHINGMAEHSGATPMDMRNDALCGAAELILEIEQAGKEEAVYKSVATAGVVRNYPNAMNVIPGEVLLGVDIRGVDASSLDRTENRIKTAAKRICENRGLTYFRETISSIPPIKMTQEMQLKLAAAAKKLKLSHRVMMSGAGHDAMSFAEICKTAMIFIPCEKGISHNKREFTSIQNICDGARVIYEYLKGEAYDSD